MKEISIFDLNCNFIKMFQKDWALVTAGDAKAYNPMTVSWGSVGSLWGKEVVTVYIRKSRYTHDFMEEKDGFTVSFYPQEYREALSLCGRESGREMDKAKEAHLRPVFDPMGVYFEGASLTLFCKKLYRDSFQEKLMPPEIKKFYEDNDFHDFYIGEIIMVLSE